MAARIERGDGPLSFDIAAIRGLLMLRAWGLLSLELDDRNHFADMLVSMNAWKVRRDNV